MMRPFRLIWPALAGVLLAFPHPALALISHGHPEGLYVHQIAHLLFAGAMVFLIYMLTREGLQRISGFQILIWANVFFIWWNLHAFVGHVAEVMLSEQAFLGLPGDPAQRLVMADGTAWIYYATQMDHLILVPAYYLFYRGLKALVRQPKGESG